MTCVQKRGGFRHWGFVPAAKTRCSGSGSVSPMCTLTHRGSSPGLCSRMLDSLKILVNWETETMECFVGMFLPLCFRREELPQWTRPKQSEVCVSFSRPTYLFRNGSASSEPKSPESCKALMPLPLCFLFHVIFCLSLLIPWLSSSVFSPLFPWFSLRESSDISRVCPAPHSSAASEECLVHSSTLTGCWFHSCICWNSSLLVVLVYTNGLRSVLIIFYICFKTLGFFCFSVK